MGNTRSLHKKIKKEDEDKDGSLGKRDDATQKAFQRWMFFSKSRKNTLLGLRKCSWFIAALNAGVYSRGRGPTRGRGGGKSQVRHNKGAVDAQCRASVSGLFKLKR